jgi:hypothetical protein
MVYVCLFDLGARMGVRPFWGRCFPNLDIMCGLPPLWGSAPSMGGPGEQTPGILPGGVAVGRAVALRNLQVCGSRCPENGVSWVAWQGVRGVSALRCDRPNATSPRCDGQNATRHGGERWGPQGPCSSPGRGHLQVRSATFCEEWNWSARQVGVATSHEAQSWSAGV